MDLTSYIASMSVSMATGQRSTERFHSNAVKEHRQHRAKRGRGG